MTGADLLTRWSSPDFRDELARWVDARLAERDESRTGPLTAVKVRFWSAVHTVPLASGQAFVKVANPGQAFEGQLLDALARRTPEHVVGPWATEPERGWTLLPDGGATLATHSDPDWLGLVGDVAELQRAWSARGDHLLPVLPRYALSDAVGRVTRLLDQLGALPAHDPQHLDPAALATAYRGLPRLEEAVEVLRDSGIPDTLQPNDVHPGNAVGPRVPGGPTRLFDLGDALWSHPWAVMHSPVRGLCGARLSEPRPDTPEARRLLDGYAEHWPEVDRADRAALVHAADRLGALHRVESWRRLLEHADPSRLGVPTPVLATWLGQALAGPTPARRA